MPAVGNLAKTPLLEILPYALDCNVLKSAIGVAALNAVSQVVLEPVEPARFSIFKDKDGFELLSILPHLKHVKCNAIIGPTASMMPDAFFRTGISVMAGVRISDPEKRVAILKQGGWSYHLLKECCEKIAFHNETSDSDFGNRDVSVSNPRNGR